MTWNLFPRKRPTKRSGSRPKKKTFIPEFERLEVRWLPSSITLALVNDTSSGLKITSDAHLTGALSDPGYSVANKTVSFSGGITGSTTSDGSGNYTYNPSL